MKRQGYIFQNIVDYDKIKYAILKASKDKRSRRSVKKILCDLDYYTLKLQNMLINNEFTPAVPVEKTIISGGKERQVYMVPFFPDLCVQWAVINAIEPILMKGMYYHTYGSIPKKGMHAAKSAVEKWIRKDKRYTKYCNARMFYRKGIQPYINIKQLKEVIRNESRKLHKTSPLQC